MITVHHHRLTEIERRVIRLHRYAGQQIRQFQLLIGQAGIFTAKHQRRLVHPLAALTQLAQQLLRRTVIMKTRTAAGRGGYGEIYVRQCLFQRGESLHAVEDIPRPMSNPTRRRLQVRFAVDNAQRSKAHGFHCPRRSADVFRPCRSH
ncbi:hypothetical protein D3C72_1849540 [compost metagenome]